MPLDVKDPEIHFLLDGETIEIEVMHVDGPACEALSKPYTEMFNITDVRKKAEYDKPVAKQSQQQRHKL